MCSKPRAEVAAVDGKAGAGDVGARVGRKQQQGTVKVGGTAKAALRNAADHGGARFGRRRRRG